MLDADLAGLYGVPTKRLNEQVKRNAARFPPDFMFRLTRAEVEELNRSQIATGSQKHRDPRFPPFAFIEHGAIKEDKVVIVDLGADQEKAGEATMVLRLPSTHFERYGACYTRT